MVFINRNQIQKKREANYRKKGISPKSLQATTRLNSKNDIFENDTLQTLIQERLGSTENYLEQEDEYVIELLSDTFFALSDTLTHYKNMLPSNVSNSINKTNFNHLFASEFGFFI